MTFISAQSRWVLLDAINGDTLLTIEELMDKYQMTRYKALKIRKVLTDAGFIVTRNENQGGGFIMKRTYVTTAGYDYMENEPSNRSSNIRRRSIELLHKPIELTSLLVPNTRIDNKLQKTLKTVKEENMGYEFFASSESEDDDLADAKKQRAILSQEDFEERKERRQKSKFVHRSGVPKSKWSPLDVAAEFADRSRDLWGFPTWNVTETRFAFAISDCRKRHDTNGEVELGMIDIFFGYVKQENYANGDMLWRSFIKHYPKLATVVKARSVTSEKLEAAELQAEESWWGFDDVQTD
jgi:hypothetical protein